jgi:hypothetical protein
MRHDSGLAASSPARYILEMAERAPTASRLDFTGPTYVVFPR